MIAALIGVAAGALGVGYVAGGLTMYYRLGGGAPTTDAAARDEAKVLQERVDELASENATLVRRLAAARAPDRKGG